MIDRIPTAADVARMRRDGYGPGEVIFFDSFVPHASKPNLTDSPRRILYITYNLAREGDHRKRYFADKHASFPPDIDRDREKTYVFRV